MESAKYWKDKLAAQMDPEWAQEIDAFETEIQLKKKGKLADQVFAETRLRKGAYGQRYDNGIRYNGHESVEIPFPDKDITKGPGTYWNAPGMLRIKLPFGGLTSDQLNVMADLAEEYSDSILHITTRQDIQLHFIHIEDTPSMFRRLASVGITTTEACGNAVRNVTACPISGVCRDQSFDMTGYADAIFRFLLLHPDAQDFGRKFKISLSGCKQHPCGLSNMHDLGLIGRIKNENGKETKGFEVYVGGGLGAVPYNAKMLSEFVSEEELLPVIQAICRVYQKHGEKKKRHMARIKFLVEKLGIDEFIRMVFEEKEKLSYDPRWTSYLKDIEKADEKGHLSIENKQVDFSNASNEDPEFASFLETNVSPQRQEGYYIVTLNVPLGDITSYQARVLAEISQKYIGDTMRTSVEQNILLRWVRGEDVYALYKELKEIKLADAGAGTIVDITSCPGTDTCKLGISASRGLASVLREHLAAKNASREEAIKNLKIKVSGCFNSCGQHHLADIGFYGTSRIVNGYAVPHFQLVIGGEFKNNGGSYGMAIGNYPSKAILKIVDSLTDMYLNGKDGAESFKSFVARIGKKEIVASLKEHAPVPLYEENSNFYTDWGDVREFSMKDKGIGECAGEVVTPTDFGLKLADREQFEAQLLVDEGKIAEAAELSFKCMHHTAQALVKYIDPDVSDDPKLVLELFDKHFHATKLIHDPFGGDRFVQYYHNAFEDSNEKLTTESAQRKVEESRLFLEAAHNCNLKIASKGLEVLKTELAEAGQK